MKFYDVRDTLKAYPNAHYYVIYGERSNGKTYAVCAEAILENFIKSGFIEQGAIIRRYDEDFRC